MADAGFSSKSKEKALIKGSTEMSKIVCCYNISLLHGGCRRITFVVTIKPEFKPEWIVDVHSDFPYGMKDLGVAKGLIYGIVKQVMGYIRDEICELKDVNAICYDDVERVMSIHLDKLRSRLKSILEAMDVDYEYQSDIMCRALSKDGALALVYNRYTNKWYLDLTEYTQLPEQPGTVKLNIPEAWLMSVENRLNISGYNTVLDRISSSIRLTETNGSLSAGL